MKRLTTALLASAALYVSSAMAADDYVILELNNQQIKRSEVDAIWNGLFPEGKALDFDSVEEPIRQNVLRGVISEYVIYNEALKAGVDKQPKVQAEIADMTRKVVDRAFLESKSASLVAESDIKAAYDKMVQDMQGKEEVRARHILVKTEEEAKGIKKQLDDGADFEKLATKHSSDTGSKVQGGDLGYFTKEQMVKEFADKAFDTKIGAVSDPVKSQFGWHVIKVEDRRKVTPPTYTDSKDKIKQKLSQDKLNGLVSGLLNSAGVKYFSKDGKELDFTKVPEAKAKE